MLDSVQNLFNTKITSEVHYYTHFIDVWTEVNFLNCKVNDNREPDLFPGIEISPSQYWVRIQSRSHIIVLNIYTYLIEGLEYNTEPR